MSNSAPLAAGVLKATYDYLDAATRLESDLATIWEATSVKQLELLTTRLEAEKALREVHAVLSARHGAHEAREYLDDGLRAIGNASSMQDLQLMVMRLRAEKAARELNAMIQPR